MGRLSLGRLSLGRLSLTMRMQELAMIPKGLPLSKVVVVPLFLKKQMSTKGDYNNWTYHELDLPEVTRWGPHLFGIIAHTNSEYMSTYFTWKLVFWRSNDGKTWVPTPPNEVFLVISVGTRDGDMLQAACTTTSEFGLHMKFGIAIKNGGTSSAIETGVISAALAFNFLT